MIQQHQNKFNWRQTLAALAISLGAIALIKSPVSATPQKTTSQADFKLAQVGIRSRINSPTPLNISPPPGTHIPLPESNYHRSSRRDYPQQRRYSRYGRYDRYYNNDRHHHHDHYHSRHRRRHDRKNRSVIIIHPSRHSSYSNNSNYIRVIRK